MVFMCAHAHERANDAAFEAEAGCWDQRTLESFLQTWEVCGCLTQTPCEGKGAEAWAGVPAATREVLRPLLLGLGHLSQWQSFPLARSHNEKYLKDLAVHAVCFPQHQLHTKSRGTKQNQTRVTVGPLITAVVGTIC